MERIKNILEEMGYTTKKGIGSEFEIFAYDEENNSIACVLSGNTFSAVSNRDVETQEYPEFYEVDAADKDAIIIAAHNAMFKDASLK